MTTMIAATIIVLINFDRNQKGGCASKPPTARRHVRVAPWSIPPLPLATRDEDISPLPFPTMHTPLKNKKILFATTPAAGHFKPLTGLAQYLKQAGNDVRWYTTCDFEKKAPTIY
ncbi:MAG: hypothetical protein ACJ8HI_23475 [Massilia sp.]